MRVTFQVQLFIKPPHPNLLPPGGEDIFGNPAAKLRGIVKFKWPNKPLLLAVLSGYFLAFPWFATDSIAFFISSGSPR